MQKSIRKGTVGRVGVAALGVGILTAVGSGAAFGAVDEKSVDVNVTIAPNETDGALALTVAGGTAGLTETGKAAVGADRVFEGLLPTVTVTDTRPAGTITDPAVEWYVVGSVADFTGGAGQDAILAGEAFGWEPVVTAGDREFVAPGDVVAPDDGGFADGAEELLYSHSSPDAPSGPGSWSANAKLKLQTASDVTPGSYSSTITLSLFEDDGQ